MSDPRLTDLLADRSERGEPRGADQVWAAASEPDYVAEAPPPLRPGLWLAAAVTCLFLVVAGLAVVRQGGGQISVADRFDDGSERAAHCLLEIDPGSDRSLDDWAEVVDADPAYQRVAVQETPGTYFLGSENGRMVTIGDGVHGISFDAHPGSAAETLADEAGVDELTCVEIPPWFRMPDPIPDGMTVLAMVKDNDESVYELAYAIDRMPWLAMEHISPDRLQELVEPALADQPDVLASLRLDELRGHQTLYMVDDDDAEWVIEEFSARDDVHAVVRVPQDQ